MGDFVVPLNLGTEVLDGLQMRISQAGHAGDGYKAQLAKEEIFMGEGVVPEGMGEDDEVERGSMGVSGAVRQLAFAAAFGRLH